MRERPYRMRCTERGCDEPDHRWYLVNAEFREPERSTAIAVRDSSPRFTGLPTARSPWQRVEDEWLRMGKRYMPVELALRIMTTSPNTVQAVGRRATGTAANYRRATARIRQEIEGGFVRKDCVRIAGERVMVLERTTRSFPAPGRKSS